jgi:hypothetical protein
LYAIYRNNSQVSFQTCIVLFIIPIHQTEETCGENKDLKFENLQKIQRRNSKE